MKKAKRSLAVLLAFVLLFSAGVSATASEKYRSGDVDGDKQITPVDARLTLRASIGLEQYEKDSVEFMAADVNGSGVVEPEDARMILRASVNLEDTERWHFKPGEYVLSLTADKTELEPGDTVTLTLHLKNCSNVACFQFVFFSDGPVSPVRLNSNRFSTEDGTDFTFDSNETNGAMNYSGMITTTYDFSDDDLCTVTYQVAPDAEPGYSMFFAAVPVQFTTSPDDEGYFLRDYAEFLKTPLIQLNIREPLEAAFEDEANVCTF